MSDPSDELRAAAEKIGVGHYRRHVFLCTGPSCCSPEDGLKAWEALKAGIKEHQLGTGPDACHRSKVGCLRICCHGPTMVVYPEGTWYHGMTAERIPQFIQEHLVENRPIAAWTFGANPLGANEPSPPRD